MRRGVSSYLYFYFVSNLFPISVGDTVASKICMQINVQESYGASLSQTILRHVFLKRATLPLLYSFLYSNR